MPVHFPFWSAATRELQPFWDLYTLQVQYRLVISTTAQTNTNFQPNIPIALVVMSIDGGLQASIPLWWVEYDIALTVKPRTRDQAQASSESIIRSAAMFRFGRAPLLPSKVNTTHVGPICLSFSNIFLYWYGRCKREWVRVNGTHQGTNHPNTESQQCWNPRTALYLASDFAHITVHSKLRWNSC